ncbi:MAG: CRISPR-associated endonuclease Cas2 [Chloroflexi bacterium]|nr:CRISPR-associated endonuclease Cas2 [Chloroflexota bacterium]MCI0649457.1 CRISPR-associated endonuclease Cas2 [Chloroflexota bacterium]MCI0731872.1 CRISPR-associated endonuclease Cas2 [Chloroflexota bacterium]
MSDTTLFLIAYDIPNDRRRTRVHKILSGFGQWTQYSIFECFLTDKELVALHGRLDKVLNPTQDNVRFYHVCHACQSKTETIGSSPPAEDRLYLI